MKALFSKASTNFSNRLYEFKVSGRFAQLRSLRQGKNRDHMTHQSKNISKNLKQINFPYLLPIPKCPKLSHVA
eukprot:UN13048